MYYQLPKKLFTQDEYCSLSLHAILLYCILNDRVRLSEKTCRLDDSGTPYIFFSRREMSKILRVSERSSIRYMKELEKAGLIRFGSKEGCTSPPIYVKDILERKKPAQPKPVEQAKSYDDDQLHEALIRQFMAM